VTLTLRGALTDDPFGGRKFQFVKPPASLARFFRAAFVKRIIGYVVHVPRRSEVEQQTEQLFPARGQFIIKDFELSTRFPFGFWVQRRRLRVLEATVFVFPQITDVRGELTAFSRQIGGFVTGKRGTGQELLGLRDYQTSDDVRRVDWKATARTGQLTVREFASEDERRVTIILNRNLEEPDEEKRSERFERGVSLAASLAAHFTAEKNEIRFCVDGEINDFGTGKIHLHDILRRLSVAESSENAKTPSEVEIKIPESEGELQIIVTPEANQTDLPADALVLTY
jgi:uncharacterized protein (DUF58 family)